MLHATPRPDARLTKRLAELDELHRRLGRQVVSPAAWMGTLRRLAQTLAVESSTSIEGFHVPHDEALAIVTGRAAADPTDDNRMAVACYARAMDHVGAMADDPSFRWLDRVILDLHFDACRFQRDKSPGRWRTGPIGVTGSDGRVVYQAPDAADVPALMDEVVHWLDSGDRSAHVAVRAAMAHLHVVSVHPFRDGNGRVSRIVQSLVLARDGIVSPEFASIEEHLSTHTAEYYEALRRVQGDGLYDPRQDARSWVAFCVDAHLAQAHRRLFQIEQAAERWERLEQLVAGRGWPDRLTIALEQALIGGTDRARYAHEADVAHVTATGDLRRLLDAGLLGPLGAGRSTRYEPTDALRAAAAG
ncbi:MAG TPA: Fic family protein [Conexibacter sp.]|nr:Fic family protein [Conexibacter sp.]